MPLFDPSIAAFGDRCQKLVEGAKSLAEDAAYLEHMERLWRTYKPFASQDFQRQLLLDDGKFYSLTWEMILGARLLENGYHLERSIDDNRPDLCLILKGKRIWIECCLPTGGDPLKPNSVTETISDGEFHDVDLDRSVLRCTGPLSKKKKQHQIWIAHRVCNQDEPFLIALNGLNLRLQIFSNSLPQILRALYAAGDMYAVLDSKDPEYRESGYHFRPRVVKSEETPISTTFFLETENNHISGVLFSTDWIMRSSSSPQYCYVENINAVNRTGALFTDFSQTYEYHGNQIRLQ